MVDSNSEQADGIDERVSAAPPNPLTMPIDPATLEPSKPSLPPPPDRRAADTLLYSASRAATAVALLLFSRAVLWRNLSKDDIGIYNQIMMWVALMPVLLSFGLPKAVYYYVPRLNGTRRFMTRVLALATAYGVFGACLMLLFGDVLAKALSIEGLETYLVAVAGFILLGVFHQLLDPTLITHGRTRLLSGLVLVLVALQIASVAIPIFSGQGVLGLIHWQLAWYVLPAALALLAVWRLPTKGSDAPTYRALWAYTLPLGASGLSHLIGRYVDNLLVLGFFPGDPATFALYSAGAMEIPLVSTVVFSVFSVLMPVYSRLFHDGNLDALVHNFKETAQRLALWLMPIFGFFLCMGGVFMVWLQTEKAAPAATVFVIYVLMLPTRIFGLDVLLQAMGRPTVVLRAAAYGVLTNVIVSSTLLAIFHSLWAAAAGTVLSLMYWDFVYPLRTVTRSLDKKMSEFLPVGFVLKPILCAILAGTPGLVLGLWREDLGLAPFHVLLIGGTALVVIYAGLALALGLVAKSDLVLARGVMSRMIRSLRRTREG